MKRAIGYVLLIAIVLPMAVPAQAGERGRSDILVMLSDDMNRHHPGLNGAPVATPNLDRLAREGVSIIRLQGRRSPERSAYRATGHSRVCEMGGCQFGFGPAASRAVILSTMALFRSAMFTSPLGSSWRS